MHGTFGLIRGHGQGRTRHGRDWLVPFVLVAIVAALVAIVPGFSSERRAIRAMPDEQRSALLSRTVDELRQLCGEARPDGLEGHCRELASFAARFDECRGECEALVHRQLAPNPTR